MQLRIFFPGGASRGTRAVFETGPGVLLQGAECNDGSRQRFDRFGPRLKSVSSGVALVRQRRRRLDQPVSLRRDEDSQVHSQPQVRRPLLSAVRSPSHQPDTRCPRTCFPAPADQVGAIKEKILPTLGKTNSTHTNRLFFIKVLLSLVCY